MTTDPNGEYMVPGNGYTQDMARDPMWAHALDSELGA